MNAFVELIKRKWNISFLRYAKHVQDRLSHGLDIPALKFEGSKVIAIFDNKSEKIGPICKGVYRAAKMRQIKDRPIEFNVLW